MLQCFVAPLTILAASLCRLLAWLFQFEYYLVEQSQTEDILFQEDVQLP